MADLEERLTKNTIITLTNDASHHHFWRDRADQLIAAPGRLSTPNRESFEEGHVSLGEAARNELAAQMRSYYDGRTDELTRHEDDPTSGLVSDYLNIAIAHIDWHKVADQFLPESVEA